MATNIQKLGDQIVDALSKPRKGGNNAMSSIIRGDEYKKVAASQVSGKNLKALQSDVLSKLGPSSQEGKAFSKLLADHQNAKTGGTFAEQFSKALRGTPVKQASKTVKSTKPKGGAAQSYGRKMYNKMTPEQQRALQTASVDAKKGSILDAVLDNSDKKNFDDYLAAIDQNNGTSLFGQPAQTAPQVAKQTPQTTNQTTNQTQTGGNAQKTSAADLSTEKSGMRQFIDKVNPVGTPLRTFVTAAAVPSVAAGYRSIVSLPREEAEQKKQFYSDAENRQKEVAGALADTLLQGYGMSSPEEPAEESGTLPSTPSRRTLLETADSTLPDIPPGMQIPQDDPQVFLEDNAVITQPPKQGAKR